MWSDHLHFRQISYFLVGAFLKIDSTYVRKQILLMRIYYPSNVFRRGEKKLKNVCSKNQNQCILNNYTLIDSNI